MTSTRIEVVCVGTELLSGKVNSHVAYLGRMLSGIGLSISAEHTVGDDQSDMAELFSSAWKRSDIILCAGGLGPTFDDETREVWSKVLGRRLIFRRELALDIKRKFKDRGLSMPPANIRQAYVLNGASALDNRFGTAPGQVLRCGKKTLFLLPGPARELTPMVERFVIPELRQLNSGLFVEQKTLLIFGEAESLIDQKIRPVVEQAKRWKRVNVTFGILASQAIVSVKFIVSGRDVMAVSSIKIKLTRILRRLLFPRVFGEDNDTLASVVAQQLIHLKYTLAVAESCSGGLLSEMITSQSGASQYFVEGVVSYANSSKMRRLGVSHSTINRFGAVSSQTARAMALGIRKTARCSIGLSITGIAGPLGGSHDKPIGRVYIGCALPHRCVVNRYQFSGDRSNIRQRAALSALDLLRQNLTV